MSAQMIETKDYRRVSRITIGGMKLRVLAQELVHNASDDRESTEIIGKIGKIANALMTIAAEADENV